MWRIKFLVCIVLSTPVLGMQGLSSTTANRSFIPLQVGLLPPFQFYVDVMLNEPHKAEMIMGNYLVTELYLQSLHLLLSTVSECRREISPQSEKNVEIGEPLIWEIAETISRIVQAHTKKLVCDSSSEGPLRVEEKIIAKLNTQIQATRFQSRKWIEENYSVSRQFFGTHTSGPSFTDEKNSECSLVDDLDRLRLLVQREMELVSKLITAAKDALRKEFSSKTFIGFSPREVFLAAKISTDIFHFGFGEGQVIETGVCGRDCALFIDRLMHNDPAQSLSKYPRETFPMVFGDRDKYAIVAPDASHFLKMILGHVPTPGALGSDVAHYVDGDFEKSSEFEPLLEKIRYSLAKKNPVIVEVSGEIFDTDGHWIAVISYVPESDIYFVVDCTRGNLHFMSPSCLKECMDQNKTFRSKLLQNFGALQFASAGLFFATWMPCAIMDYFSNTDYLDAGALALIDLFRIDQRESFSRYNAIFLKQ